MCWALPSLSTHIQRISTALCLRAAGAYAHGDPTERALAAQLQALAAQLGGEVG